ncbi:MAG: hypothetical protein ACOYVK_02285 [Bacillota bacterium]
MSKDLRRYFCYFAAAMMAFVFSLSAFSCVFAENEKKAIVIIINEVNYEDLSAMDSVKKFIVGGSIGLMNNRTSSKASIAKAYMTIGTGVRAEASYDTSQFANVNVENIPIYERRTGLTAEKTGVVNLNIAELIRLNLDGEYGAVPGALGQALHEKDIKTAVIGNGDTDELTIRTAPLIAMDQNGYIDYGSVNKDLLTKDGTFPFGIRSDYSKMMEYFREVYPKSGLTVIDFNDITRLERYKSYLTDEMYTKHKNAILQDIDAFLDHMLESVDLDNSRLFVVTPYPSANDYKNGNRLTPLIVYGDEVPTGVLTSDTTRREGVIGNVDIAPSIVEYLGAKTEVMTGRSLTFIPKVDNYQYIMERNEQIVATSKNRFPVLSAFAVFEIFVSITALILILIQEKLHPKLVGTFKDVLLSTMTVPFVLLIMPLFIKTSVLMSFVVLILTTVGITYIVKIICSNKLDRVIILSALTTIGLLVDIATNSNLIKNSLLGYDPIIGARYYGLGNEYMGVLIGATIVWATAMTDRFKISRIWAAIIFTVTILIIGYPSLGANVGGTITAVAAFLLVALRIFNIKIRFKSLSLIGTAVILVVSIMAYVDIKLMGSKSHLAGAIQQIMTAGPGIVFLIIKRKIAMNLKLIGVTIWSKVLISTILILGVLFYRPIGTIYKLTKTYPNLSIGWTGIVAACVVGFIVNDSGVVAAATATIFLAMSMLYLTFYLPIEK